MSSHSLPIVDYRDVEGSPSTEDIAGVLLAAGTSTRFGSRNKLTVTMDGAPLVRHARTTLAAAGLDPLLAVVGHESSAVADALDDGRFELVENPAYETGKATSVAAGIRALPSGIDAAVFALGDMPAVDVASVAALVAAYRAGEGTALAAAVDGARGNPVLFDARHFDALSDVSGDVGGREILLGGDESALVATGDPGVRMDVDTPEDLRSLAGDP